MARVPGGEARGRGLRGFAIFLSPQPSAVQPSLLRLARQGKLSLPLAVPVESDGPGQLAHVTPNHLAAVLADVKRLAE